MARIGELHAIIVMATVSSAAVALFIKFPKAGMIALLGFLAVSIVLTVAQQVKPAAAGSLRGHMAVIATAPARLLFLASLTGFLVLALLTAPIIWLCAAGYATFLVVAQLRSERPVVEAPEAPKVADAVVETAPDSRPEAGALARWI
jgi:hypothetical protein